jgi:hypothetical protein
MSSHPELKLDWCDHAAAKYAVEHWHYSRSLPMPPLVRVGAWEAGKFIGVVLFGRGASSHLVDPYGLDMTEGAELVRVAFDKHVTPVSRIVAIAIRMMRRQNPGLRLLVSFADPREGHVGGIYQAGGWIYCGQTAPEAGYLAPDGKLWHNRMVSPQGVRRSFKNPHRVWRPDQCRIIRLPGKHRYLMPFDDEIRAKILPLAKPYPKKSAISIAGDAAVSPDGGTRFKSDDGAPTSVKENLLNR